MSSPGPRGPIVIDTDLFSADLVRTSRLAERYTPLTAGCPALVSFQTVAELRYGALLRNWGDGRLAKLEAKIQRAEIVHTGTDLTVVYAQLRGACRAAGHALAQREHNPDRWIAATATAVRLRVPLVSNDGIFLGVPGLALQTISET